MNEFFTENRIYYHDTDAGGVVYYAAYLEHLEEGRTEYCRSKGIDIADYARNGLIFPVVHLEIDYKSPARYGDTVRIYTRPQEMGNASFSFAQEIRKGEALILKAKTVWACVNRDLKPTRIPEEFRKKIGAT